MKNVILYISSALIIGYSDGLYVIPFFIGLPLADTASAEIYAPAYCCSGIIYDNQSYAQKEVFQFELKANV
tara:strand:- start:145 stop:357 length:213 start_codon:yes stop_codon:yes gene_type:complete